MGVHIHIPADAVWGFFQASRKRLNKEMVLIAENTDTEYAVYLTEENDLPVLAVAKGNEKIEYKEPCVSEEDCTAVSKKFYTRYLFPVVITDNKYVPGDNPDGGKEESDETWMDIEDAMYERDDELCLAMADFLAIALQEGDNDGTNILEAYGYEAVDEILDGFLKELSEDYGFHIYRPMIITEKESGCEVFTEFPYDEYDIDGTDEPDPPYTYDDGNTYADLGNTNWYGWFRMENYKNVPNRDYFDTDTYDCWGYIGESEDGSHYFEVYRDGMPDDPVITMWVNVYDDHIEPILDGYDWVLDQNITESDAYKFNLYPYNDSISLFMYDYEGDDGTACAVSFYMRLDGTEWNEELEELPPRYEEYKAALANK